tara:strand:- start:14175 stop:14402 length:228 start_codon:yes stop_codon:yes gene_type:complete
MNIDLKDFIEGNNDLFTICIYKEAESVLSKFLEWHKVSISFTRCCETFYCHSEEASGLRCGTQCLGCDGMERNKR